jgi:hypothetical protein
MPECRCRTEAANFRKKCGCRTNFSPAFRHLHMIFQYHIARITPSVAVYGGAGCITFHYLQFESALGIPFTTTNNRFVKCRNVGLSGIQSVRYRNEQHFRCRCRCRNQFGTGMLRYLTEIQDAGMPMPAASTSMPMPSYCYSVPVIV